jgi:AcrR family transcriptional regulator
MSPRRGSSNGRATIEPSSTQQTRRGVGPVTRKGVNRRREIVDAARSVFEQRGYLETRVSDIVEAADVAQGTFYTYFDSKDAVFREVATQVNADMMEAMHASQWAIGETPEDRARAAMVRFIEAFRPNAIIISLLDQAGTVSPEMAELRLALRNTFVDRLRVGIERLQSDGMADPDIDPWTMAEALGAMVDQVCFVWFSLGKDFDYQQVVDTLTTVWSKTVLKAPTQK